MEGLVRQQSGAPVKSLGRAECFRWGFRVKEDRHTRSDARVSCRSGLGELGQLLEIEWRVAPLPSSACWDWTSELSFSLWSLQYYRINSSKDCRELSSGWFQGHILLLDWFTLRSGGEPVWVWNGAVGDKRVWVWSGAVGDCSTFRVSPMTSDNSWQFTNVVCITSVLELCVC